MCVICRNAGKMPPAQVLDLIGKAMQNGANPEHFKKLTDKLLGTEETEDDPELAAAWERSHRPR